jgi:hypothetical protein
MLDKRLPAGNTEHLMDAGPEAPLDLLWKEYGLVFRDFDDVTLARWMAQTLGQIEGKVWRLSHPLLEAYRLAAGVAHQRQIWLQRLVASPAPYAESSCCRAPFLPLLSRDVREAGLVCQHCHGTLVPFEELPLTLRGELERWAAEYAELHQVAHWEEAERRAAGDYDAAFERAATQAEQALRFLGQELAHRFLEFYPAIVWEDQDECLEIRPEDVLF